ncbi:ankyrin-1-like [Trichogramma pretiosum]|uniref:ankyrin-1-like n=1 Tax=Trichogramma pretiosum TaxID=7493 RepID=UPI000C719E85|nr:ankyrin-1-like [Trichogramma pretiosum]
MALPDNPPVYVDGFERRMFFGEKSVNWYSRDERRRVTRFLVQRRPNLRQICRADEIDYLLYDCVEKPWDLKNSRSVNRLFIDYVVASGYEDVPVILINPENRVNRNEPRPFPRVSALHRLAEYYHGHSRAERYLVDVARQLFQSVFRRFDVNCIDVKTGWTHLQAACVFGLVDQVRQFLDHGHDPDYPWWETHDTPLHVAARNGDKKMIELLVSRGAKPTLLNRDKLTPLDVFLMAGHGDDVPLVWMMLEAGRDEFQPDKVHQLLRWAVTKSLPNVTKLLLSNGADPTFDPSSRPTKSYIRHTKQSTLSLMFETFDDGHLLAMLSMTFGQRLLTIDARDNTRGGRAEPLLHMALARGRTNTRTAWMLLKLRADPNALNAEGRTALHVLCDREPDVSLTKWFFDAIDEMGLRLDIDARDNDGCTALHLAVQGRRRESAELLLERGADPNATTTLRQEQGHTSGWSPLHSALSRGYIELAELLLRNGADPDAADAEGSTPLLVICKTGWPGSNDGSLERFFEICDELRLTLRLDVADHEGRTPLQWAVCSLRPSAIDALLDRGADLAGFVFPSADCFAARFRSTIVRGRTVELQIVSSALRTIERLESRGYEPKRSDALTIMTFLQPYMRHCEQLTRGFFRAWAIECLIELTGFRLPLECYEKIIDYDSIVNTVLHQICLATTVQSS